MATRRLNPEDWSPVYQTRITTRPAFEPRDERVRIPSKSERALRPKPLNIPPRQLQSPPDLKAPPPSRGESSDYGCDSPRDPEIIDFAPANTWPRRESPAQRSRQKQSPKRSSTRQSEISLGILDYYIRDRTPSLHSPELPPPTPQVDPAIEKFDFGLPPTPTPSAAPEPPPSDTKPGAERRDQPLIPVSPPICTPSRPPVPPKGYSLFPVIKQVTPPPRQPTVCEPVTLRDITPTSSVISSPYAAPPSSYRPRKESVSSSARSRNDSFISSAAASRREKRTPIPLRIISSDSTSTATTSRTRQTSASISTLNASSPPATGQMVSRWSDDTIASPTLAPTPGPRTSFGSLLRRDSAQYPDCFFEDDDDEQKPLHRKRGWRKSPGASSGSTSTVTYQPQKPEQTFGRKLARALLCGCGGR